MAFVIGLIWWGARSESNQGDTIKIGAVFSLTGPGATWGENNLRGAQLAVEELNNNCGVLGRQLELVVEDNQTEARDSVSAAQKLVNLNGAQFLLAGWTEHVLPLVPFINQEKIVTITVSAGAPDVAKQSSYLFRTWPSDVFPIQNLIVVAQSNGWRKVAVAQTIGPWEDGLRQAFIKEAELTGLQVLEATQSPLGTKDFRTDIAKLQTAKPDVVYLPVQTSSLSSFVQQSAQLGFRPQFFYAVDLNTQENVEGVGDISLLEGFIYPIYARSDEDFIQAFKDEYGEQPGVAADTAYDAVYMLARAIEKAGTTDADVVRSSFQDFDGASGRIAFDSDGDRSSAPVILMTVKNGRFVEL